MIIVKSLHEIKIMREAGKIVSKVFKELEEKIKPGIKTEELNDLAEELILKMKARPAFKGYRGYPKAICTSINEEVVHGIPGPRRLKEGDLISIDLGVLFKDYYADAAKTFEVGEVSGEIKRLIQTTYTALEKGISCAKAGNYLGDISNTIQNYVEKNGFSVVRDLVGHGIGKELHEEPQIPNFGNRGEGPKLVPGMTFAIEPMVNMGDYRIKVKDDGWTIVSLDGSLSCHFEHTISITEDGPEILTNA